MKISKRGKMMPASPIRKLASLGDRARAKGIKVYNVNIGQPDIRTPPEMLSVFKGFSSDVLSYGPSGGLLETRVAVSKYLERLGTPISPDNILITQGGSEAILFAMMAVCDQGDEIIVFEPFYTNYMGFARMAGVVLKPLETSAENGFRPPSKGEILQAITDKTKAILYCSPCNPTGCVLTREEIGDIIDVAKEKDLFVLGDEVYREFVYGEMRHVGLLEVAAEKSALDRVIMLDSISKRFSACGARVGYLVTHNKEIIETCLRFGQARLCPPTVEQMLAIAGYSVYDKYIPPMIDEYRKRRDVVMEHLSMIPFATCAVPDGAFYAMPKLPIEDGDSFAEFLISDFSLDGETVMVAPGAGFYATEGKGLHEIRIAYVLEIGALEKAMKILRLGIEAFAERKHL